MSVVSLSNRIESADESSPEKLSINNTKFRAIRPQGYLSEIEASILRSKDVPIEINETDELTVLGYHGIWANKSEEINWKGMTPISEYSINEDSNPLVITKNVRQQLEYVQELAVRYLKPPTPPAPGEIVITKTPNVLTPPAPPLIIRQQPPRPPTPEPLIVREQPPQPPPNVGRKIITISGKRLPPPPRKVIIERLAPLPSKPQSVIVERWLPYKDKLKRKVLFQKAPIDPVVVKPRNVVVQWEAPNVSIKKEYKYLGVIRANPVEYVQKYGPSLKSSNDLPQYVLDAKNPDGIVLAADHKSTDTVYELEGDVDALRAINQLDRDFLDREGLSEYKPYLNKYISKTISNNNNNNNNSDNITINNDSIKNTNNNITSTSSINTYSVYSIPTSTTYPSSATFPSNTTFPSNATCPSSSNSNYTINLTNTKSSNLVTSIESELEKIFRLIDNNNTGQISFNEATRIILRLINRLGIRRSVNLVEDYLRSLANNPEMTINLEQFKKAFFYLQD